MKVEDAAERSGFAIWTVRRMARQGLFMATKPRGNRGGWEIDDESFHDWMQGNQTARGNAAYQAMRGVAAALVAGLLLPLLGGCQAYEAYNAAYERELRAEIGTDGKRIVWAIKPRAPVVTGSAPRAASGPAGIPAIDLRERPEEVPPWAP